MSPKHCRLRKPKDNGQRAEEDGATWARTRISSGPTQLVETLLASAAAGTNVEEVSYQLNYHAVRLENIGSISYM